MNIYFKEEITFSEEEQKAFDLVFHCANGIIRESKNYENVKYAEKFINAWVDLMNQLKGDE